jgi:hypothetical protein
MAPQPTIAFGPDYPATLIDLIDGVPMPLVREQRWSRTFRHPTTGAMFWIPRFMDGSATMTLEELRRSWPTWTVAERQAFSTSAPWLNEQADFAEILRSLSCMTSEDLLAYIEAPKARQPAVEAKLKARIGLLMKRIKKNEPCLRPKPWVARPER